MSKPIRSIEAEKKICLCMIVKNESRIIERCLNSSKSIIDFVSICDTGSTDHTPKIIENWCKENKIPGIVHYESFKNFGYNRSKAVSLAQDTYPEADYFLLLDADMILKVQPEFKKNDLNEDKYMIMQFNNRIKYWNTRLIKTSLPWECVGVTHEYWAIDHSKLQTKQSNYIEKQGKLSSLIIDDQGDGGSKSDKFVRDKRLLVEGINDESTSASLKIRYLFYLAQTHYCLNELEEAIKWYKKRVEAGGWAEEVFYSLFQIGICYELLGNTASLKYQQMVKENKTLHNQSKLESLILEEEQFFALAVTYFQNSWEYRPGRAEPLYQLAKMYRMKSKNNIALMYALQGKAISFPKDDILFVDYHVYDYLIDYEISICAYYIQGKQHLGESAQKYLQTKIKQLPPNIARTVESNAKFYSQTLE